ncbi:uncharacterized protein LOC131650670 [Vicia villosa]|uniref:uncharacterized protein LOC131650670 n=1 Tax=Vicia villosa TaxID=3911 RepID=UPI00273CC60B|nr:uncharacterized protein LOC131650670 [Vicia villosa]
MLHLVACTLFADKSGVYIDVQYLSLFRALDTPCWDWGVVVLTMLYTTLDAAFRPDTTYVGSTSTSFTYVSGRSSVLRLLTHVRRGGRPNRPFQEGYVKWESHVARHFPERCLRQYGYIQDIPCPLSEAPAGGINRWFQSHIINSPREIIDIAVEVQEPGQCEDGYLEWFHIVSHPRIIPPATPSDVPGPSGTRDSFDSPPPPPPPAGDQDNHLQFIAVHLDSLTVLVNSDGEVHTILARLADVSHGGPM